MRWIITGILVSYLFGSIPTAYIFGRLLKGIDIRKHGSGNVGATNALRVLGKGPGILVLALDILKGIIPVIFFGNILINNSTAIGSEAVRIILGISCICGHNWTIFLNFKGGKGIATTLGVLIALSLVIPGLKLILGLVVLTWFAVFIITRIVSVASVFAGISFPLYSLFFRGARQSRLMIATGILFSVFIIIRHKSNLARFFQGKEPQLNFKKPR